MKRRDALKTIAAGSAVLATGSLPTFAQEPTTKLKPCFQAYYFQIDNKRAWEFKPHKSVLGHIRISKEQIKNTYPRYTANIFQFEDTTFELRYFFKRGRGWNDIAIDIKGKKFHFVPSFHTEDNFFTKGNYSFTHYRFVDRGTLRIISSVVLPA